ncbi:MAG: GNAT family N-acetyltransferase, partial [Firmicutes bacterium]|nr:GNAT family N-acetyltransferase [Bacillota bacterium]
PPQIDGIEIFNGNPRHNSQNRLAAGFAARHGLRTIVGSDIHHKGDAGAVGMMVPREALTPKRFAAWLRATPHPRVQYEEPPRDGIRYRSEAIPGRAMLEALYRDAGWTSYTKNMESAVRGIEESARVVTAWDDTLLAGMARAVGDGYTILYIQDILVLGTYRRRGIGRELTRRLLAPFKDVRQIVLITEDAVDTRGFYKACGFERIDAYNCVGYIRLQ